MFDYIQAVKVHNGAWVLVETLGTVYQSRDEARVAAETLRARRAKRDQDRWNLEKALADAKAMQSNVLTC